MKRTVLRAVVVLFALLMVASFAVAAPAKPKVRFIMMGLNNPYTSAQAKYTAEWAKKLGWDYYLYDGELDPLKNASTSTTPSPRSPT
jgi:ABC-type sugar transport system substrate-binding protein